MLMCAKHKTLPRGFIPILKGDVFEDYLQNNSLPWWLVHTPKLQSKHDMYYSVNEYNVLK